MKTIKNWLKLGMILVFVVSLSACGGSGGGNGNSDVPTPTTVTVTTLATLPVNASIKSFDVDANGNVVLTCVEDSSNTVFYRYNAQGNLVAGWPRIAALPVGTQYMNVPADIATNGTLTFAMYSLLPDKAVKLSVRDEVGGLVFLKEVGSNADAGKLAVDGSIVYLSTTKLADGVMTPFIYRADSNTPDTPPLYFNPPMSPRKLVVATDGLLVVGDNIIGKVVKDFSTTTPIWNATWSTGVSPVIHDAAVFGTKTYVSGIVDNHPLVKAYDATGKILWSKSFPEMTTNQQYDNQVVLAVDSAGNVYASVQQSLLANLMKFSSTGGVVSSVFVPNSQIVMNGTIATMLDGNKIVQMDLSKI